MCIFSGSREVEVRNTCIFARLLSEQKTQRLVYQMQAGAPGPVTMILPLPVAPGTQEISWIDLSGAPDFFDQLALLFRWTSPMKGKGWTSRSLDLAEELPVVQVGSYEASFVPSQGEFHRLSERFRLDERIWQRLPYWDYGFAVFQLQFSAQENALKPFHPMAFDFPTRLERSLFFPTVHVHDGELHKNARFDHMLYAQYPIRPPGWELEGGYLHSRADVISRSTLMWLDSALPMIRMPLVGLYFNWDIVVNQASFSNKENER